MSSGDLLPHLLAPVKSLDLDLYVGVRDPSSESSCLQSNPFINWTISSAIPCLLIRTWGWVYLSFFFYLWNSFPPIPFTIWELWPYTVVSCFVLFDSPFLVFCSFGREIEGEWIWGRRGRSGGMGTCGLNVMHVRKICFNNTKEYLTRFIFIIKTA